MGNLLLGNGKTLVVNNGAQKQFGLDSRCDLNLKPHYKIAIVGSPAGSVKGLPVLSDSLAFQAISLLNNGEKSSRRRGIIFRAELSRYRKRHSEFATLRQIWRFRYVASRLRHPNSVKYLFVRFDFFQIPPRNGNHCLWLTPRYQGSFGTSALEI